MRKRRGLEILPAKKSSRVDLNDLTVERFNELVESRDDRTRKVEVLRVRKIASQNLHLYMPAQLLVYGDPESGEVELGLCVDGDLQPAHGLELAAADAVVKLGISVARPEPRPTLTPELEEQRVASDQVELSGPQVKKARKATRNRLRSRSASRTSRSVASTFTSIRNCLRRR